MLSYMYTGNHNCTSKHIIFEARLGHNFHGLIFAEANSVGEEYHENLTPKFVYIQEIALYTWIACQ